MKKKFRTHKGIELIEQIKMCKKNTYDDDNLMSVYLTLGEIDYLISLVLRDCKK